MKEAEAEEQREQEEAERRAKVREWKREKMDFILLLSTLLFLLFILLVFISFTTSNIGIYFFFFKNIQSRSSFLNCLFTVVLSEVCLKSHKFPFHFKTAYRK